MRNRPVALLHGWGGSFQTTFARHGWRDALAMLRRDLIAITLPGHSSDEPFDASSDYSDLAGLIDRELPSSPIDIVGFSLGGKIALELASRSPGRFDKIVVGGVGDNVFAPENSADAVASALVEGQTPETPSAVRALVEYSRLSGADPRALAAVLRRVANPTASAERLAAIKSAVLVINGANDHLALPDSRLLESLTRPIHALVAGVDHLQLPADVRFLDTAIQFLRPVDSVSAANRDMTHTAAP